MDWSEADTISSSRLGDLLELVIDYRGKTPKKLGGDFAESGVPVISAIHIKNGRIAWEERERFVTQEMFRKWMKDPLKKGDVLLTSEAPLGEVALVPNDDDLVLSQRLFALRPNPQLLDAPYLMYFLKSTLGQRELQDRATGSTVVGIRQAELVNISVPHPPLRRQKLVGQVLSNLDFKIDKNQELSRTLERMAVTIFKSWFIDFDPVKAKMAGEAPVGMDAETAALFPDSMEESELGEIPKGWASVSVKDLCSQLSNGSTPKRSNEAYWSEPIIDWYKTGELRDNFLLHASEGISQQGIDGSSVRVLPAGSVLMAIYAAPTVGRLGILTEESVFNQACTGLVPKPEVGTPFLYLTLKNLRGFFINRSNGAAQQNISKQIVEAAPCVSPPLEILKGFNEICGPIFELWESLTKENAILTQTRDSLLPRLISGELEIPDELLAA